MSTTFSIRIRQEGHANALALNKDCTQIAVAGRYLLKIFSIEPDGFNEVCNMRGAKNHQIHPSNDIVWSHVDSNILATAATNGVVSVWDLSRFGRQKQYLVYNEHERTTHTVTFHNTEQLLLSGSQDGTIKCFDLRVDKSVSTYFSNTEGVRDVKFSLHHTNNFAAVSENGIVQLWDIRKPDKWILNYTAHSQPVYTCDWHPTKNWLATGSRDKNIKVWSMEGKASLEYTIPTMAAVLKIKWRPDKIHQIASCALLRDYSVHVWDIRRPYIPYASFNEHTDIITGLSFKGNDANTLFSTSRDSTIFHHVFSDAVYPALKTNNHGAALNIKGDILYADKIKIANPSPTSSSKNSFAGSNRSKSTIIEEQFLMAQSSLNKFILKATYNGFSEDNKVRTPLKEYQCFVGCAKEYILKDDTLENICDHNAKISKKYGKHNATTLWTFIKRFYASTDFVYKKKETRNSLSTQNSLTSRRMTQVANQPLLQWGNEECKDDKQSESDDGIVLDDPKIMDFITPKNGESKPLFSNASQTGLIIFEKSQITSDNFKSLRDGFLYVGTHHHTKGLIFPEADLHDLQNTSKQQQQQAITNSNESREETTPPPNPPNTLKLSTIPQIPMWEPHQVMTECLLLQTEVGDVQTSLCILIAMGESRNYLSIEEDLVEYWFHSYIEELHRNQLWNEAALIINLSWIKSVRTLNQQSTTAHTGCGECGRAIESVVGWYCSKCKTTSKCCVCGLVVRGLYAWCRGCSHGGHIEHLKQWFSVQEKCPKCGHMCIYD
ncbi:GATOR complex protein WDR24 [Condylostylus longicornis]|uniref:GATOR complex protein WDR24 n=1 Tax=Condylostylus longicornis TaxID=2530218 RepID=UPI00244E50C6|nr:GATOR complex protein WDR24 [Condylostylus longicornis]